MSDFASRKVYVASGRISGAALARALPPVVADEDDLLLGPSRVKVRQHRIAREQYWGRAPSRRLDVELVRGTAPLCVVLAPTLGSLLTVTRVCSVALGRGREVQVVDLGEGVAVPPPQGADPGSAVHADAESIAPRLSSAVVWSRLEMALAATVWRLWCRRSPTAFSRFCALAGPLHPLLGNLGRYHAGWFPRVDGDRLLVSRCDDVLLRQLSRDWLTPVKIFANAVSAETPLASWASYTGDLYVLKRLTEWATHTGGRIVERREESHESEMLAWSFRWAEGGEAILDALPTLDGAPPALLGGATAYDAARPWVCRMEAGGTPIVGPIGGAKNTICK